MSREDFIERLNSDHPRIVDPPSGWQYGFPALWNPAEGSLEEFYRSKGYPEELMEDGLRHTRMWFHD